jgi:ubiquinone/menaquinone biosynthesis C-methylase UbiE
MEDGDQVRSYNLDKLDRSAEEDRLAVQARAALAMELAYFMKLGLPTDATLVDIGCGPGLLSAELARLAPQGRVIGVDADPKLLDLARARCAEQGLGHAEFVQAWADDTPLPSGGADLSYARFLFQHLPKPIDAMKEMVRIVRPGGQVMIVDTDDGGLVVDPPVEGLDRLIAGSHAGQAARGGDRHIGRKLRRYMHAAGLVDIKLEIVPFTSDMVGMQIFADICLGFKSQVVPPEHMSPEDVQATLARVHALADDPGAWGQTLAYVATGRVASDGA